MPAQPKKPTSVMVGPFEFTIDWSSQGWAEAFDNTILGQDPDVVRAFGMTDKRSCQIWINPFSAETFQRETLLH